MTDSRIAEAASWAREHTTEAESMVRTTCPHCETSIEARTDVVLVSGLAGHLRTEHPVRDLSLDPVAQQHNAAVSRSRGARPPGM